MLGQTADDQVVLVVVQHGNDQFGLRCTHLFEDLGATAVSAEDFAVNFLAQLGHDVRPPIHDFDLISLRPEGPGRGTTRRAPRQR